MEASEGAKKCFYSDGFRIAAAGESLMRRAYIGFKPLVSFAGEIGFGTELPKPLQHKSVHYICSNGFTGAGCPALLLRAATDIVAVSARSLVVKVGTMASSHAPQRSNFCNSAPDGWRCGRCRIGRVSLACISVHTRCSISGLCSPW